MRVLVTGSTGLVGSALVPFLITLGHRVTRLVRKVSTSSAGLGPSVTDALWDPVAATIDRKALEGMDAVIHLAGENIAAGRWTPQQKARLRDSRVGGTRFLAETLASLQQPPRTLVSASAIGYYGSRGSELMTEGSALGTGFLADVCRDWEAATEPAARKGVRVVHLRVGVVLSPRGGALHKMLTPFKLGVGGVIGDGRQYLSWVSLDDLIGAIHHALVTETLRGAVNAVAPHPVTNREFTKALGRVLSRPTILPLPAFAARLLLGEMADALLLASTRVAPERLLSSGYKFQHPELEGALRHVLGK